MAWDEIDIYITAISAFAAGVIAGWLTRGSMWRGLLGFVVAVAFSAALTFVPKSVSSFRLWLHVPQEISLTQELLLVGIAPCGVSITLGGVGWILGFAQYKRCTEFKG